MEFQPFEGDKMIYLLVCPFCGSDPSIKHIGNNYTRARKIEIKCTACGIKRMDATIKHNFEWLERIAAENWNKRFAL